MVHTAIMLPRDLLERIRKSAERAHHGLSAEIRLVLQVHYLLTIPFDPKTSQLLDAIKTLSEKLDRDIGTKWHENAYAWAAFKAGVEAFLARNRPDGDESVRPGTPFAGEPNDPPDVVGRTHARIIGNIGKDDGEDYEPEYEPDMPD
jgi:hypothetical protein